MLLKISFIYFIPTLVSFPPLPPARLLEDRLPEGSNEEKFPTSEIWCQCCCRSEIIEQGCRFGDLHALTDTPFYPFLTALQLQRTSIFPEQIFFSWVACHLPNGLGRLEGFFLAVDAQYPGFFSVGKGDAAAAAAEVKKRCLPDCTSLFRGRMSVPAWLLRVETRRGAQTEFEVCFQCFSFNVSHTAHEESRRKIHHLLP